MSRASPQMRKFAQRLITYETRENKSSQIKNPVVVQVSEKLRPQLATLMGSGGFRALLSRALALATVEVPWLRGMQVSGDGSLEGAGALHAQLDPDEFREGSAVLLAQTLALLAVFIGESLTVRLVCEVWPKVPLDDLDLGKGNKNEKAK